MPDFEKYNRMSGRWPGFRNVEYEEIEEAFNKAYQDMERAKKNPRHLLDDNEKHYSAIYRSVGSMEHLGKYVLTSL